MLKNTKNLPMLLKKLTSTSLVAAVNAVAVARLMLMVAEMVMMLKMRVEAEHVLQYIQYMECKVKFYKNQRTIAGVTPTPHYTKIRNIP